MFFAKTSVLTIVLLYFQQFPGICHGKYVRGHLKTLEVCETRHLLSINIHHNCAFYEVHFQTTLFFTICD